MFVFFSPLEQLIRGYSTSPTAHTDNKGFQDQKKRTRETWQRSRECCESDSRFQAVNAKQHSLFAGVGWPFFLNRLKVTDESRQWQMWQWKGRRVSTVHAQIWCTIELILLPPNSGQKESFWSITGRRQKAALGWRQFDMVREENSCL